MSHGILNYFWSADLSKSFSQLCQYLLFSINKLSFLNVFFFQYILAPHCLYRDLITLIHGTIIPTVRIIFAWLSYTNLLRRDLPHATKSCWASFYAAASIYLYMLTHSLIRNASRAIYRLFYVNIMDNWGSLKKKAF